MADCKVHIAVQQNRLVGPIDYTWRMKVKNAVTRNFRVIRILRHQELTCIKNAVPVSIKGGYFQPLDAWLGRIACFTF